MPNPDIAVGPDDIVTIVNRTIARYPNPNAPSGTNANGTASVAYNPANTYYFPPSSRQFLDVWRGEAPLKERFRPQRDDKVVAAWNGWLIDSLVQAGMVFRRPEWVAAATAAAEYLWQHHWLGGGLRRVSRLGQVGAEAAADDHGGVALGFARLAGALGEAVWLDRARTVLDAALAHYGADDGGVFDAPGGELFARARDVADNATPSGTASLVAALRLVGLLTGDPSYDERADRAVRTTWAVLAANPRFAGWPLADLLVADESTRGLRPAQVVVVGGEPGSDLVVAAWRMAPDGSALVAGPAGTEGFGHLFEGRTEPGVYVCRGETCFPPASDTVALKSVLWRRHHG